MAMRRAAHLNDKSRAVMLVGCKKRGRVSFCRPSIRMKVLLPILFLAAVSARAADSKAKADEKPSPIGYSDTPVIPGTQWKVHDIDRPRPVAVAPGEKNAGAPLPMPS
jgi:hypothetical protein